MMFVKLAIVVELACGSKSVSELVVSTGFSREDIVYGLRQLVSRGYVVVCGSGRYCLSSRGFRALFELVRLLFGSRTRARALVVEGRW